MTSTENVKSHIAVRLLESTKKKLRRLKSKNNPFYNLHSFLAKTKSWHASLATSRAIPGRRIGWADGSDRAFPYHFAKTLSEFREINLRFGLLSQEILQKQP
jgi:hypothetical protein